MFGLDVDEVVVVFVEGFKSGLFPTLLVGHARSCSMSSTDDVCLNLCDAHLAALRCTFSNCWIWSVWWGSQTGLAYSRIGRTRVLYEISFIFLLPILRFRLRNPRVWFALLHVSSMCLFQAKFS